MNTQTTAARELNEEISNAEVPPRGNQVPPLEEVANHDQAHVNPPPLTDGDVRAAFIQMAQVISAQEKFLNTETQAMTDQHNREVVPRANQHVGTMASSLRDSTRMNLLWPLSTP